MKHVKIKAAKALRDKLLMICPESMSAIDERLVNALKNLKPPYEQENE